MARIVPPPQVPNHTPFTGPGGLPNDVWILFFNKLIEYIEQQHLRGTLANRPAATDVYAGVVYFATDVPAHYRSTGTTWESYA